MVDEAIFEGRGGGCFGTGGLVVGDRAAAVAAPAAAVGVVVLSVMVNAGAVGTEMVCWPR